MLLSRVNACSSRHTVRLESGVYNPNQTASRLRRAIVVHPPQEGRSSSKCQCLPGAAEAARCPARPTAPAQRPPTPAAGRERANHFAYRPSKVSRPCHWIVVVTVSAEEFVAGKAHGELFVKRVLVLLLIAELPTSLVRTHPLILPAAKKCFWRH